MEVGGTWQKTEVKNVERAFEDTVGFPLGPHSVYYRYFLYQSWVQESLGRVG